MIGSLLYLSASRPDIMFSVCMCARFQANPKESHLSEVKRIMRYLLGTINLGLWYPKNSSYNLIGYSDSNFAGCKTDRKSTSGTCHFISFALVKNRIVLLYPLLRRNIFLLEIVVHKYFG